jgi:hypothetical protein
MPDSHALLFRNMQVQTNTAVQSMPVGGLLSGALYCMMQYCRNKS